jgi:hypothetical protein
MINGKEHGFALKRTKRDKAHKRLIKNQHFIVPAILGCGLMGALAGGSMFIAWGSDAIMLGLLAGTWIGLLTLGGIMLKDLSR